MSPIRAGGCIAAVDAVMDGRVSNAYALVRPPGHHAERDRGRGFCLLANAAIAVEHLRHERGLKRVAIVDWDVHHGNGAQSIYYDDPHVLTISIHQDRVYPVDSVLVTEDGARAGLGSCINIPLPPGSGHGAYLAAFSQVVLPALTRFQPEMIIVPCGFDASALDPMARQMAHSETYRLMTRSLKLAASDLCGGRLVMFQRTQLTRINMWLAGRVKNLSLLRRKSSTERLSYYPESLVDFDVSIKLVRALFSVARTIVSAVNSFRHDGAAPSRSSF